MDYQKWGMDYLQEAEQLRKRVAELRKLPGGKDGMQDPVLMERISMLYAMYLECLHTGTYLVEYGVKECAKKAI